MKKIIFFSILMLFLLASITAASASCIIPENCDRLWNIKWFTCDYGHENDFILQRDGTPVCGSENCPDFPCWGSVYTQSSYSAGEINWNIMDNGSLNLGHCKDNQVYGDTYLFVISPKTIHVPRESDVGRVWLNDVDITDDGGDMNLQAGWNHLEWTSYNQNQDTSFKFNYDFASNVLLMNSQPLPPDIIVEDADVIWNPMINDTPAKLNNSINAMEPRIILEYVDSINATWNATVKSVPDALNDSVNAIEPRIILEYVDSINATWNATVKSVPDALNDSVNAIEPRIILEYVDSINAMWNPDLIPVQIENESTTFDTGSGTYPSIMGTHNGTIKPYHTVNVSRMYTYPCPGTGGHTEYVRIWNESESETLAEENWKGYKGDWHNITFSEPFILLADGTYNYTIRTGSYPQIHHNRTLTVPDGEINCSEFIDANGERYDDWIPAIRLE